MRKDSEWEIIDDEPCRVIDFIPSAKVENEKVVAPNKTEPYASVILECKKISQNTKGFITHKVDFQNLWAAFKERGVGPNEEVIITWSKRGLKGYAELRGGKPPRSSA